MPERALRIAASALHLVGGASSERELMQGLRDLLVNEAGYLLAWIGLLEREPERVVRPVAWTGDEDYVRRADIHWDEGPRGQGPAGRAVREVRTVALNAAVAEETFAPWTDAAGVRGYAAACATPIALRGDVIGVLNVYAGHENAFDAREIHLVEELVAAAGRGIELFRARAETRAALEQARAARDALRAVYDASPDSIFVHGADGRVLDVNDHMLGQYGMSREEILDAPLEAIVCEPHTIDEAVANVQRAMREGGHDFEWTARRADGTVAPVEVRLRRLPELRRREDEPALVAIVRDMTEQRRLEAQLLERAKLESLASFAGGVAHDFNNFLMAVMGSLTLALHELDPRDSVRSLVEDALEAASRARGLTRQLLAYARGGGVRPVGVRSRAAPRADRATLARGQRGEGTPRARFRAPPGPGRSRPDCAGLPQPLPQRGASDADGRRAHHPGRVPRPRGG